jgi:hypothetical protein
MERSILEVRPDPIPYKDKKLYFRGTNNVLEQIKYIEDKYDIFRKNKIVVTGVSAGGIATYLYADVFLAKTITAKVYAIPDSGLFLDRLLQPFDWKSSYKRSIKGLVGYRMVRAEISFVTMSGLVR